MGRLTGRISSTRDGRRATPVRASGTSPRWRTDLPHGRQARQCVRPYGSRAPTFVQHSFDPLLDDPVVLRHAVRDDQREYPLRLDMWHSRTSPPLRLDRRV